MKTTPSTQAFPHHGLPALLAGCCLLLSSSCSSRVGSRLIETSYPNYGETVQAVLQEELLHNLVRRRVQESPQFVALRGISHTQSINRELRVGSVVARPFATQADGEAIYQKDDIPTFSISPQQGPAFAAKLHMRIPLKALPHLTNAGYPTELVLALLAQEVAGVRGVETSASNQFRPGSPQFGDLLSAVQVLDDQHHLKIENVLWEEPEFEHAFGPEVFSPDQISSVQDGNKRYITLDGGESFYVTSEHLLPALWIHPAARSAGAGRKLMSLLKLDSSPGREAWVLQVPKFIQGKRPSSPQHFVTIQTRSFYAVLNLLALGVRMPGMEEAEASSAKQKYGKAVAAGLAPDIASRFVIHHSPTRPRSASVATKTDWGWYYIERRDTSSQTIFNALYDLYQLQVAPASETDATVPRPVLSIRTR